MTNQDYTSSFNKMITAMGESNGRLELINVDTSSLVKSVDSLYDLFKGNALAAKEKESENKLSAGGAATGANIAKGPASGKAADVDVGLGGAGAAIAGATAVSAAGAGLGGFLAGIGMVSGPALLGVGVLTALGLAVAAIGAVGGMAMGAIGDGLDDLAIGIDTLDDVGGKVDPKNLENAAEGLKNFFDGVLGWGSAGGAAITTLTGDLDTLAVGLGKLNDLKVDEAHLTKVGEGLANFLSGAGSGSLWSSIKGSAVSALAPDMMTLGTGIDTLNETAGRFNSAAWSAMGIGVGEMNKPLADLISTAFSGNFVGSDSLSDIANGITALNETKVDKLGNVVAGFKLLDGDLFEVVKTAMAGTFAGNKSLTDISHGITTLNETKVDKLGNVAEGFKIIDKPLYALAKTGIFANGVSNEAFTDMASQLTQLQNELGGEESVKKALTTKKAIDIMIPALNSWKDVDIGGGMFSSNGVEDALESFKDLSDISPGLKTAGDAIGSLGGGIEKIANTNIDTSLGAVAKALKNHIPAINEQINSLANNQTNFRRAFKNLQRFEKLDYSGSVELNNAISAKDANETSGATGNNISDNSSRVSNSGNSTTTNINYGAMHNPTDGIQRWDYNEGI